MAERDRLTPKQARFLEAYLQRGTLATACKEAEVPESTARRWRTHDAVFIEALRLARQDLVAGAVFHLQRLADVAVASLYRLMTDERPGPGAMVRLRAAQSILEHALAVTREEREHAEVLAALAALRTRLEAL